MPETASPPVADPVLSAVAKLNKVEAYSSKLTVELPPAATGIFQKMLDETKMSPAELVWNALSLLSVARDAQAQGLSVGAAESPDKLKVEWAGF